jgi:hypothetical protein
MSENATGFAENAGFIGLLASILVCGECGNTVKIYPILG